MRTIRVPVRVLVLVPALLLAACSSGSEGDGPSAGSTSTTLARSTTSTTAAFDGTVEPTSIPLGREDTALLRTLTVTDDTEGDHVTFTFLGTGLPKVDVSYVDEAIADGSGERIEVTGGALLMVRFEPAATHDLRGEQPRRVYEGTDRVPGEGVVVTEVVNGGSFEGVLSFYVGVRKTAPYRLTGSGNTVELTFGAS